MNCPPQKKARSKRTTNARKCFQIRQELPQSGAQTCASRGQCNSPRPLPVPSLSLPWYPGSHAGLGVQGEERGQQPPGNPMLAKRELVPLGWKRNTHTASPRGFRSPPSASSASCTSSHPCEPEGALQQHSHMVTALGSGSGSLI